MIFFKILGDGLRLRLMGTLRCPPTSRRLRGPWRLQRSYIWDICLGPGSVFKIRRMGLFDMFLGRFSYNCNDWTIYEPTRVWHLETFFGRFWCLLLRENHLHDGRVPARGRTPTISTWDLCQQNGLKSCFRVSLALSASLALTGRYWTWELRFECDIESLRGEHIYSTYTSYIQYIYIKYAVHIHHTHTFF